MYVQPVVVDPIAFAWKSGWNGKPPNAGLVKSRPLAPYTKLVPSTAISRFLVKLPGKSIFSPYVRRKVPLTSSGDHTNATFGANTKSVPISLR